MTTATDTAAPPRVHVRWMIRRDLPAVLEIDRFEFARPWDEEGFLARLRRRDCVGIVAEAPPCDINGDGVVVGYTIYDLHKKHLEAFAFAAETAEAADALVAKLRSKLSSHRRTLLTVVPREPTRERHRFWAERGFVIAGAAPGGYRLASDYYEGRVPAWALDPALDPALEHMPPDIQWDWLLDRGWVS